MLRTLSVLAIVALGLPAGGCTDAPAPELTPPPGWAGDEATIRAATAASVDAWNRGDLEGHLSFYSESTTFMTSSGPEHGIASIEERFMKKYFDSGAPKQTLSMDQVVVRPLGHQAALETGRYLLSGGGMQDQSGWYTAVWLRTALGWRIVHDHSN